MAQRMSADYVEKRLQKNRAMEHNRNDLLSWSRQNEAQTVKNASDAYSDVRRRANRNAQIAAENLMEEKRRTEMYIKKNDDRNEQQNQALAAQLQKMNVEEQRRMREMERICQESPELQELENRLKMAYMNKERGQQLTEAAQLNELEKRRHRAIEQKMEFDRQEGLRREAELQQHKRYEAIQQKGVLQQQMMEREKLMLEAQEAYKKDKEMVDSVFEKILAEDRKEQEDKMKKVQLTKNEIEKYKLQRQKEKEEAQRIQQEEDSKIRAYAQERIAREQGVQAKKAEKAAKEERAFRAIEEKLQHERRQQDEMDRLREALWTEEKEDRIRQKERIKQEARERARLDMMQANTQQKEMKQLKLAEQRRQDEEIKRKMLMKFEEDERLEAQTQARREAQKRDFKKNIEEAKREKEMLYQQELSSEMARREALAEEERFRAQVIEEARKRMLEEHARALQGFLPKGVLSNKEDLSMLQQFDSNNDGTLDADELSKAQARFMNYDADGDGRLDESEKQNAWGALQRGQFR